MVAGRIGQEYNQRKKRKGAFWEDRYHATAIETEQHLLRCLVYIDLNMVRAGVVDHPSEWRFGGYNEIQFPKRKCVLIAYHKLAALTGFKTYEGFKEAHRGQVEEILRNGNNSYQGEWSQSIAVGGKIFIEEIKEKFGILAKGRQALGCDGTFQLREPSVFYNAVSDPKKEHIGTQNTYFWKTN